MAIEDDQLTGDERDDFIERDDILDELDDLVVDFIEDVILGEYE